MAPFIQTGNEEARGAAVADPAAITSAAAVAAPTKAEYDTLRADVIAVRTTLQALLTALRDTNIVD